jgi:hypothetical protein
VDSKDDDDKAFVARVPRFGHPERAYACDGCLLRDLRWRWALVPVAYESMTEKAACPTMPRHGFVLRPTSAAPRRKACGPHVPSSRPVRHDVLSLGCIWIHQLGDPICLLMP